MAQTLDADRHLPPWPRYEFVSDELGALAGLDRRAEKLRATLESYFASAMSATCTAARLGVHDQTVANRLRAIEHSIGHSIQTGRAELEVALRLRAVHEPTQEIRWSLAE